VSTRRQIDIIMMLCYFYTMIRTQIQVSEELYREAKRVCREREMSLAELVRRGLEYVTSIHPPLSKMKGEWELPKPMHFGAPKAPEEEWRLLANEWETPRLITTISAKTRHRKL